MKRWLHKLSQPGAMLLIAIMLPLAWCGLGGDCRLLTADQAGYLSFHRQDFLNSADRFSDPFWRASALYRNGDFKQAAHLYAGQQSAEALYNRGNALLMQGKYEDAVEQYSQALALRPDWQAAMDNRALAKARAEMVKQTGGNMTEGKMGADDFVFNKGKSPKSPGDDEQFETEESGRGDRKVWLRQVQTRPADFLRSKFAWQQSMKSQQGK